MSREDRSPERRLSEDSLSKKDLDATVYKVQVCRGVHGQRAIQKIINGTMSHSHSNNGRHVNGGCHNTPPQLEQFCIVQCILHLY
jgi:hypothetical protein